MIYAEFKQGLSSAQLRPAYLFLGKEDFLAEEGIKALIDRILPSEDRSLNLVRFYGRDATGLPEALTTPPIFGSRTVVEVHHAQELNAKNLSFIDKYLSQTSDDCCLILWADIEEKARRRGAREEGAAEPAKLSTRWSSALMEKVVCALPKPRELPNWIGEYLKRWNKRMDSKALGRLTAIHWPSLRELAGELERLSLLVGEEPVIRAEDIEELGGGSFALERWRLTDAVASGNRVAALTAAETLLRWNTEATGIIFDLHRLFHRLWLMNWAVRKNQLKRVSKELSLLPFLFDKYTEYAQRIGGQKLAAGLLRIEEADRNIKTGTRPPELELNLLLADLIR